MAKIIILSAHGFEAEVWTRGAHVARLLHRAGGVETPMLYTPQIYQPGDTPRFFGSWPMVPFCNRAYGAKYDSGFAVENVPVNDPAGFNIHGDGWQADWAVEKREDSRVVLRHIALKSSGFSYVARLGVSLDAGGVTFDLALTNPGSGTCLFGMGFHPWFPRDDETKLCFNSGGEIYTGDAFRPFGCGSTRKAHDFSTARVVRPELDGKDAELAANYLNWDGIARLDWPNRGKSLRILASPNLRTPLVWSPVGADFVCFEPQSHGVGAQTEGLMRAIAPLTPLGKGQSMHGTMRLSLEDFAG